MQHSQSILHSDPLLHSLAVRWLDPASSPELIQRLNQSAGVSSCKHLTDYGGFHSQKNAFWFFEPLEESSTVLGLERAKLLGLRIRVRGAGHSMNGSSLPMKGQILLSTLQLNQLEQLHRDVIEVGAGAQIWQLNQVLMKHELALPVIHDGELPASTVGGFVCAGGFGASSSTFGGFWNHIFKIRIWDPKQGLVDLTPDQKKFWHICGSGGFDGVILSVQLRVIGSGYLPQSYRVTMKSVEHPRIIWFTIIAPKSRSIILKREISKLHLRIMNNWEPLMPYSYLIKYLETPTPVNFHPVQESDLIACGVWGTIKQESQFELTSALSVVKQSIENVPDSVRYWQSELI